MAHAARSTSEAANGLMAANSTYNRPNAMPSPAIRYRVFGRHESFDRTGMRELIRRGELTSITDVAVDGTDDWKPAGNYPELLRYLSLAASTRQGSAPQRQAVADTNTMQIAIGCLIAIAGIFIVLWACKDFVPGVASTRWPAVEASLVSSQLVPHEHYSRRRYRRRTTYEAWVHYNYTVGGQRYNSNRIVFGSDWDLGASYKLDRIRRANPLLAHYDPDNPSRAVLSTGPAIGPTFWLLAGLAVTAFGVVVIMRPDLATRLNRSIGAASRIRLGRNRTDDD